MVFGPLFHDETHAEIVLEEVDPASMPADLSLLRPEEAEAMSRAVDKRRREYTAGRVLVRKALRRLGMPEVALINGEDRAPQWPSGLVGSITHTRGLCAVAIAPQGRVRAIGLDVEQDEPLKPALLDMICTEAEMQQLAKLGESDGGLAAKVIFSAKECAYKAQYLLTQQYLGFQAMTVEVRDARWRATFNQPSGDVFQVGDIIEGTWRRDRGLVATAIVLRE